WKALPWTLARPGFRIVRRGGGPRQCGAAAPSLRSLHDAAGRMMAGRPGPQAVTCRSAPSIAWTERMRRPVFELHIVPMIRAMDRAHMLGVRGDLWDYDFHIQFAERILASLDGGLLMPTPETGGPWPPEWVL